MARIVPCIRFMIPHDIEYAVAISYSSPLPWAADDFYQCIQHKNCTGLVAEVGQQMVGFTIFEEQKAYISILNMYVEEDMRRMGIGHAMVSKLKSKLTLNACTAMFARVHERDQGTLHFMLSEDFYGVGVINEYYDDDDAYEMRYQLPEFAQWAYFNRIAKTLAALEQ